MAQRPVFLPLSHGTPWVRTVDATFDWHPGLSVAQKQKSVASLHASARRLPGVARVLEVSSKSTESLGVALSAFNLAMPALPNGARPSVECAFQASKVFENGGPFVDLLGKSSREAKQDPRLQLSGRLTGFSMDGVDWPLDPPTAFYDWIYLMALQESPALLDAAAGYDAFSDIEFNPARSINCQAHSLALAVALHRVGQLRTATASPNAFSNCLQKVPPADTPQDAGTQGALF